MEIQKVYVKTRAEFGKQCIFDISDPILDLEIMPNPSDMNHYIMRTHCHVSAQHSKQLALHQAQTTGKTARNSGMFHFEGGWPREINPRDEEATLRFRRRVEKDDNWAPKLRSLFEVMEHSILQNGAINIYQHYFDDMIPTQMVRPLGLRAVNVYVDPATTQRPVSGISWSPDSGSRIAVSYCFLEFGRKADYSNTVHIWQVDNPNEPYMALEPFCPCVSCEFNPRDPSVLASGLMTGQVCNWDIRTGTTPVQSSHLQFSHRDYTNGVRWLPSKSNTEFFSTSSDGRAMWWDTRWLRKPTEAIVFDLEYPNEPILERAIGLSCLSSGPLVGTKFMFGMDNGIIVTGSRKAKTSAEKMAVKFLAHHGPVLSVDRNVFNPAIFLSIGDWTARIWAEDTREGNLVSTVFLLDYPTGGCWNKVRQSVFYVITATGCLIAWDLLQGLRDPILTLQLCNESLTVIAPYEEGTHFAIGNSAGKVFLVESMEFLQSFDRKERGILSEYFERCSKLTKAVDLRLRELKLVEKISAKKEEKAVSAGKLKEKAKDKGKSKAAKGSTVDAKDKAQDSKGIRERRKSGAKEKKKVREDFPEQAEAEQKYFEIIDKELEKYLAENDPDVCPVRQVLGPLKKQDRGRRKSKYQSDADEDGTKHEQKKSVRGKKILTDVPKTSKEEETLKRPSGFERSSAEMAVASSVKTAKKDRSKERQRRAKVEEPARKRRKQKVLFALPKPCKGEVCKPNVCCWGSSRRKKGKKRLSRRSVSVSMRGLKDDSSLKLSKQQAVSGSHILREMLDPPSVLVHEVERAKQEIREFVWSRDKPKKSVEKAPVSRPKRRRRKRPARKSKNVQRKEVDRISKREESINEEKRERKKVKVIVDPCSPRKTKDIAEEFSKILDISVPESIEERVVGRTYLEEPEAARVRFYPRISEFHPAE